MESFASTRPVQIATQADRRARCTFAFASTRPVQIATRHASYGVEQAHTLPPHAPCRLQRFFRALCRAHIVLCLHTPRADCNIFRLRSDTQTYTLPPHAPCRLQRASCLEQFDFEDFASTRPVQIATAAAASSPALFFSLPPHAPCRLQQIKPVLYPRQKGFASTRPVQIATNRKEEQAPCRTFASTRPVQIATTTAVFPALR